jgi:hypothetical protein
MELRGAGSRMHTHGVCFDATSCVNRDRIVQCGVIFTMTAMACELRFPRA